MKSSFTMMEAPTRRRDRLLPYAEIAPLTVLHGETRQGTPTRSTACAARYPGARRYPRRDAMILMQGDFTDQPEHLPELVKRFEGGADIVVSEREAGKAPASVRRLLTLAPWTLKFFVDIQGVTDPFNGFRLYRISLLRDLIKSFGDKPLVTSEGWAANVELLMNTAAACPQNRARDTCAALRRTRAREQDSSGFRGNGSLPFWLGFAGRKIVASTAAPPAPATVGKHERSRNRLRRAGRVRESDRSQESSASWPCSRPLLR